MADHYGSEHALRIHAHNLLYTYSMTYLCRDYNTFIEEGVNDVLYEGLVHIPEVDPKSITLPADPFLELFEINKIHDSDPYGQEDRLTVGQDPAQSLMKELQIWANTNPNLKSDTIWHEEEKYDYNMALSRPTSPILTLNAQKESLKLGSLALGYAPNRTRALLAYLDPAPILHEGHSPESLGLDDIEDLRPTISTDIKFDIMNYYRSVLSMNVSSSEPRTPPPAHRYLHQSSPSPQLSDKSWSPPIFSAQRRTLGYSATTLPHNLSATPHLEALLPVAPIVDEDMEDLAEQHIIVVDGWHSFAPRSTPSPLPTPSLASGTSDVDELIRSPSSVTDPTDGDVKMDIPIFPLSERIEGASKRHIRRLDAKSPSELLSTILPHDKPLDINSNLPSFISNDNHGYITGQSGPISKNIKPSILPAEFDNPFDQAFLSACDSASLLHFGGPIMEEILEVPRNLMTLPTLSAPSLSGSQFRLGNLGHLVAGSFSIGQTLSRIQSIPILAPIALKSLQLELSWSPFVDAYIKTLSDDEILAIPRGMQEGLNRDNPGMLHILDNACDYDTSIPNDATPGAEIAILRRWELDYAEHSFHDNREASDFEILLTREERRRLTGLTSEGPSQRANIPNHDDGSTKRQRISPETQSFMRPNDCHSDGQTKMSQQHSPGDQSWANDSALKTLQRTVRSVSGVNYRTGPLPTSPLVNGNIALSVGSIAAPERATLPAPTKILSTQNQPQQLTDLRAGFDTSFKHSPASSPLSQHQTVIQPSSNPLSTLRSRSLQAIQAPTTTNVQSLLEFLHLRANPVAYLHPSLPNLSPPQLLQDDSKPTSPTPVVALDKAPSQLIDRRTIILPDSFPVFSQRHTYLASLNLVEKSALVHSLLSGKINIEIVERESLAGVDLIIDPHSSIVFTSLLSLPVDCDNMIKVLSSLSYRYTRIFVIFECFPSSATNINMSKTEPHKYRLHAFSPAVIKAVQKLRRGLSIAEGCQEKLESSDIWYAFASDVKEAALFARLFGNYVQELDTTGGVLWDERYWLSNVDENEDELYLAAADGMNHFAAAVILTQTTLDVFLDGLTPRERMDHFGGLVGQIRVETLNKLIAARTEINHDLPASSPLEAGSGHTLFTLESLSDGILL